MSLIDEALRRARQEAARQDAVRRDERYRQVPVLPPMASRKRPGPSRALAGAGIAAGCVVLIAIGMVLGRREPLSRETASVSQPAEAISQPREVTSQPREVTSQPREVTSQPREVTSQPREVTSQPREVASQPREVTSQPWEVTSQPREVTSQPWEATSQPREAAPVVTPPASPPPAPIPAETAPEIQTFVRAATLPDGSAVRLNGIAFSSTQPVALIDDRVLTRGESYRGFLVSDIQPGFVELKGDGVTLRVSLK